MKKIILNITAVGVLVFLLAACSKKTTAPNSNQSPRSNQQTRQPRGERPQFSDLLSKMDKNQDKKLSQSEVQGPLKNNFAKIDKDQDGFITEAEFKNAPAPPQRGRN